VGLAHIQNYLIIVFSPAALFFYRSRKSWSPKTKY